MVRLEDLKIRRAEEEDIPQLLNLLNSQYNNKFNREYFLWQYLNKDVKNMMFCIVKEKAVIGMFGVLQKGLNNGLIGLQAADMLIAKEYRKQGLFCQIAEYAFNSFEKKDFLFVLPNLAGKNAVERTLHWKTLFRINEWQLNSDEFHKKELINRSTNKSSFLSFKYDNDALAWRFDQSPLYKYNKISFPSGRYAYIKKYEDILNKKSYIDIVFFSGDDIGFEELAEFINTLVAQSEKFTLSSWALPGTTLSTYLPKLGFIEAQKERYFCISSFVDAKLDDPGLWNLYQSDTEFY